MKYFYAEAKSYSIISQIKHNLQAEVRQEYK